VASGPSSGLQDLLALNAQELGDGIVVHGDDFLQPIGKCLEICNRINVVEIHNFVALVHGSHAGCHRSHNVNLGGVSRMRMLLKQSVEILNQIKLVCQFVRFQVADAERVKHNNHHTGNDAKDARKSQDEFGN